MKKILFALILSLLIQPLAFAEGEELSEIAENDTETAEITEENEENRINLVNLYVFSKGIDLSSFPVFENQTLMLPIKEFLSHLGANDFSVDAENQITITYGKNIVAMHLYSTNASFNHEDTELSQSPFLIDDIVYAPAEAVCKALGFTFKSDTDGSAMSVYADLPENELASEKSINSKDLPSETQYLVWVNKSKYTVYVFLGNDKNWREVYSCKCSIGAPDSPTVTGVFKYISRESRWTYDDFYVGPIMRFYGSYAIHSTLLKFDGSDYNNAVGVKNSHGCVRVRPDNLNWLVSYVPLKTTVYVSEN
ncbi:MAG: L,D-transpeptidase family protein [Clostridia bacterium]|nr:L,D-transpeptidase family protein [Clostridia bacterium]